MIRLTYICVSLTIRVTASAFSFLLFGWYESKLDFWVTKGKLIIMMKSLFAEWFHLLTVDEGAILGSEVMQVCLLKAVSVLYGGMFAAYADIINIQKQICISTNDSLLVNEWHSPFVLHINHYKLRLFKFLKYFLFHHANLILRQQDDIIVVVIRIWYQRLSQTYMSSNLEISILFLNIIILHIEILLVVWIVRDHHFLFMGFFKNLK